MNEMEMEKTENDKERKEIKVSEHLFFYADDPVKIMYKLGNKANWLKYISNQTAQTLLTEDEKNQLRMHRELMTQIEKDQASTDPIMGEDLVKQRLAEIFPGYSEALNGTMDEKTIEKPTQPTVDNIPQSTANIPKSKEEALARKQGQQATTAVATAPVSSSEYPGFSPDEIEIIKDHIARGASDAELKYFLYIAKLRNLNPLLHEIYWIRRHRRNKATGQYEDTDTILIGIDGARKLAERSGRVDGVTVDVEYGIQGNLEYGVATLWLKGASHPFVARAKFSEYQPRSSDDTSLWKTMPETMIKKVAEMLVYRMAFAAELGGLYIKEEMDQAD